MLTRIFLYRRHPGYKCVCVVAGVVVKWSDVTEASAQVPAMRLAKAREPHLPPLPVMGISPN